MADTDAADSQWLEIGKIVGPQGVHGEMRVYPNTDFPERFLQPGLRWLRYPNLEHPQEVELLGGRYLDKKGLYVVQLQGVRNRQQAELLRDGRFMVPARDRPTLEAGEFHVLDLLGLEVFDQETQSHLGTVVDVFPAGNDLLEVQLKLEPTTVDQSYPSVASPSQNLEVQNPPEDPKKTQFLRKKGRKRQRKARSSGSSKKTVLIPFVEAIVPLVDVDQGRVEVVLPPGLIDVS